MDSIQKNYSWIIESWVNETTTTSHELGKSETVKKMSTANVVFLIIAILGMIGNTISIFALSKSKQLRNATTAFIVNLCVADLLYCILTFFNFVQPNWNYNHTFCKWFPAARYWVAGESVYTLVAITINRYICVVHPSVYHSWYKPKYLAMMITVTWLYALMLALFPFFEVWGRYGLHTKIGICTVLKLNGKSPINFFFISAFAFPTFAFAVCYPRIFWVVHRASKRARKFSVLKSPAALNATTLSSEERMICGRYVELPPKVEPDRQNEKEIKILKVMLVIVVGFIICYFPVAFIKIFEMETKLPALTVIAYLGINLSNVINPIIYVVMSDEYRKAYTELFSFKKIWASLTNSSDA